MKYSSPTINIFFTLSTAFASVKHMLFDYSYSHVQIAPAVQYVARVLHFSASSLDKYIYFSYVHLSESKLHKSFIVYKKQRQLLRKSSIAQSKQTTYNKNRCRGDISGVSQLSAGTRAGIEGVIHALNELLI